MDATWFACAGCGCRPPASTPIPLVCPAARPDDGIDHVLVRHLDLAAGLFAVDIDQHARAAFLRFGSNLAQRRIVAQRARQFVGPVDDLG